MYGPERGRRPARTYDPCTGAGTHGPVTFGKLNDRLAKRAAPASTVGLTLMAPMEHYSRSTAFVFDGRSDDDRSESGPGCRRRLILPGLCRLLAVVKPHRTCGSTAYGSDAERARFVFGLGRCQTRAAGPQSRGGEGRITPPVISSSFYKSSPRGGIFDFSFGGWGGG